MNTEVFGRASFIEYAKENLICVSLDFPRKTKLNPIHKEKNEALAKKFGIHQFPTIVLLNSRGNEIKRFYYNYQSSKMFIRQIDPYMDR